MKSIITILFTLRLDHGCNEPEITEYYKHFPVEKYYNICNRTLVIDQRIKLFMTAINIFIQCTTASDMTVIICTIINVYDVCISLIIYTEDIKK